MSDRPPALRRAALAVVLVPVLLGSAARALPRDEPDLSHAGRLASCSGTAIPRASGGAAVSGSPYFAMSPNVICFAHAELDEPRRVLLRLIVGPTFSGEAAATFGEGSVGGMFVAGQLVSGTASALVEAPEGTSTLVLLAGRSAALGQGGQSLRPLCVPPIQDPGCGVVVPVPFVYATAGPLGAVGTLAAEVRNPA
ncbi:MAG TPA: hypothetical protein VHH92_06025 [Actinomycetota bacterium]|nr:hypothetical protein [Actinomycetota bacterium]